MRFLTSMIGWMKKFNVVLAMFGAVIAISALLWMFFSGGISIVHAQGMPAEPQTTTVSAGGAGTQSSGWGIGLLSAALATGLSAIAAGIAVAMVGSAAMGAVAERPEVMGRSIIFVGLAEGIAIYGLIISIMILGKL